MAKLNSQISALLKTGADAMDNLFDVSIYLPYAVTQALNESSVMTPEDLQTALSLRCMGFEAPKFTAKTYDVPFKTAKVKRAAGKIEGERTFKLQFRLDAYYQVYRALLAWRAAHFQPGTGFATSSINAMDGNKKSFYGVIEVLATSVPIHNITNGPRYDFYGLTSGQVDRGASFGADNSSLVWAFRDAWVIDVDPPTFKTGNGDIQVITATFGFQEFIEPQLLDYYPPQSDIGIIPT